MRLVVREQFGNIIYYKGYYYSHIYHKSLLMYYHQNREFRVDLYQFQSLADYGQHSKNPTSLLLKFAILILAVANAPVPVTTDMNIKILVNLKLPPRRHTDTLIFTSIHLMYLMIHFLCRKLKNIIASEIFFQI